MEGTRNEREIQDVRELPKQLDLEHAANIKVSPPNGNKLLYFELQRHSCIDMPSIVGYKAFMV